MKRVYSFCLAGCILCAKPMVATLSYGLTTTPGFGFTPIAGTAITNLTNGCNDGMVSGTLNIGFTFVYDSQNYTQFKVTENGRLFLGTSAVTCSDNCGAPCDGFGPNYQVQPSSGAGNGLSGSIVRPAICPLWDDLGFNVTGSKATYTTTGSAGSRVLTVEWILVDWKYNNVNMAGTSTISFQVKLYEAPAGQIDFIYRQEAEPVTAAVLNGRIGLIGVSAGDYYSTNHLGATPSKTAETNVNAKPGTGLLMRWSVGVPTPVELLSFSVIKMINGNELTWETASEKDNDLFTIDRSTDAKIFEAIAWVKGAGNSSSTFIYHFLDDALPTEQPVFYYRLKQSDLNGVSSFSGLVSVDMTEIKSEPPDIHYNNDSDVLQVSASFDKAGSYLVEVCDITGRVICKENLFVNSGGKSSFSVPVASLSHGLYNVKITGGMMSIVSKFVNY